MAYEVQELLPTWRAVLAKRSYENKVALPRDLRRFDNKMATDLLNTITNMTDAGWLRHIDNLGVHAIHQLTPEATTMIQVAKVKRDAAIRDPSVFHPIGQETMIDATNMITEALKLPRQSFLLIANPDVFKPDSFSLCLVNQTLSDDQQQALIKLTTLIPRLQSWYAGMLLRPAANEWHVSFWAEP